MSIVVLLTAVAIVAFNLVLDTTDVAVARERDDMRALAQRVQADFENYRKRAVRDQERLVAHAHERLVRWHERRTGAAIATHRRVNALRCKRIAHRQYFLRQCRCNTE